MITTKQLVIAGIIAFGSFVWLIIGAAIPYPLIRSIVYTSAAFLSVTSLSIVASHWLDLSALTFKKSRNSNQLKKRVVLSLVVFSASCSLLGLWNLQEDRELVEAKAFYANEDYEFAKELFLQQRIRFWTTERMYVELSAAISACDYGLRRQSLRERRFAYVAGEEPYETIDLEMRRLETSRNDKYPWSTGDEPY